MEIVVCEHDYWKAGQEIQMIHNHEKGIIENVERHDTLLVLDIDFFSNGKRKVASYLIEKVITVEVEE